MRTHYRALTLALVLGAAATATFAQTQPPVNSAARPTTGGVFNSGLPNSNTVFNGNTPAPDMMNRNMGRPQAVTPVPEPSQWAMMLAGLALVGFIVRRNAKRG